MEHKRLYIPQLTGLRGIAAIEVMAMHIWPSRFGFHNQAVDLFFALSGFTLALVYVSENKLNFKSFFISRFARIYPLYFVVLIVASVYSVAWGNNNFFYEFGYSVSQRWTDFILQLLAINAWPVIGTGIHWVAPLWSISVEFFCYLFIFPPLYFWITRHQTATKTNLVIAAFLPLVAIAFYTLYFDGRVNQPVVDPTYEELSYWVAIMRGISMFSSGMLLWTCWHKLPVLTEKLGRKTDLIVLICLLMIGISGFGGPPTLNATLLLFPWLILGLTNDRSLSAQILSNRVFHFLGLISYSIYLVHNPVIMIMAHFHGDFDTPLIKIAAFATSLLVATSTYFLIEKPARNFIKNRYT